MGKGLREKEERSQYIIYGRRCVREYLRTNPDVGGIESVFIATGEKTNRFDLPDNIPLVLEKRHSRNDLNRLFPDINHQGIILRLKNGYFPHNQKIDWVEFIREKNGLLIALIDLQDAQNLGSIIRSAESLGARTIFITGHGAQLNPVVDHISAGASFLMPIYTVFNPSQLLSRAKKLGYWIAVASGFDEFKSKVEKIVTGEHKKKSSPLQINANETALLPLAQETLLFIGGEGQGVRYQIHKNADFIITIPAHGRIASLNAGVAAGIMIDRLINR